MTTTADQIAETRDELSGLGGAAVCDALGNHSALPPGIQPLWRPMTLVGPAYTIRSEPGDNLAFHRAVAECPPQVVLVAATENSVAVPVWGGLLSSIAIAKGVLGLVTDGAVRDSDEIRSLGFPVFCRGTSLYKPAKASAGTIGEAIVIDGVEIRPGDWVLADADGVVVIPADDLQQATEGAKAIVRREAEIIRRAKLGETTIVQLGL